MANVQLKCKDKTGIKLKLKFVSTLYMVKSVLFMEIVACKFEKKNKLKPIYQLLQKTLLKLTEIKQ